MRISIIFAIQIASLSLIAAPIPTVKPVDLYRNNAQFEEPAKPVPSRDLSSKVSKPVKKTIIADSNLPDYYLNNPQREPGAGRIYTPTNVKEALPLAAVAGKEFAIEINHSILAFLDEPAPVVAKISSGALRGYTLIGSSRLDRNTERVFIDFKTLAHGTQEYAIRATFLTETGEPGIVGNFYSREMKYASADFISTFMAAYFDAQVPRHRNVFGQEVADTSVDSAVKKGLATSSLAVANRFREKLQNAEAFCEVRGPISARAVIISSL